MIGPPNSSSRPALRAAVARQPGGHLSPTRLRPVRHRRAAKKGELPRACANRLARAKARTALAVVRSTRSLPAPTSSPPTRWWRSAGAILPKAELLDEARQCLRLLSGRNHRVHTSVCLVTPKQAFASAGRRRAYASSGCRTTTSRPISRRRVARQGRRLCARASPAASSSRSSASYSNVVGLRSTNDHAARRRGYPIHFGWLNAI